MPPCLGFTLTFQSIKTQLKIQRGGDMGSVGKVLAAQEWEHEL